MLQTSNLVRKYKHICGFKKYSFQYQDPLNFADVSIFAKHQYESCVRDSLVLFSVFVRQKVTVNENVSFTDYTSGLRLPNCSKLVIYPKNDNNVGIPIQRYRQTFFILPCFFFSSLVTGPSFTSISLLVLELWQFSSIKG